MRRKGTLVDDGEFSTLTFHRVYPHAPTRVWEAISTPEGLREWLMCSLVKIDPRVGGEIELVSGAGAYHSTGKILAWEPPRLLEYEWNVAPVPGMPQGERAIFRYELVEQGAATHLTVTYRRMTRHTARGFLPGTHAFLDRLEAQLERRPLPNWLQRFEAIRDEYPEWSAHAADSRE